MGLREEFEAFHLSIKDLGTSVRSKAFQVIGPDLEALTLSIKESKIHLGSGSALSEGSLSTRILDRFDQTTAPIVGIAEYFYARLFDKLSPARIAERARNLMEYL